MSAPGTPLSPEIDCLIEKRDACGQASTQPSDIKGTSRRNGLVGGDSGFAVGAYTLCEATAHPDDDVLWHSTVESSAPGSSPKVLLLKSRGGQPHIELILSAGSLSGRPQTYSGLVQI